MDCKYVIYGLHCIMLQILRTSEFDAWITGLRDKVAQKQMLVRLARLSLGNGQTFKGVNDEPQSSLKTWHQTL